MASEADNGREVLNQNAFVEKLIPDPSQPAPPTTVFEGLLGKSSREGYWRLYLTNKLNDYLEFREGDILNGISIPQEQSRLGLESTKVWLRGDASIEHTRLQSTQARSFLRAAEEGSPGFPAPRPCRDCTLLYLACITVKSRGECAGEYLDCRITCIPDRGVNPI